jgi:ubiquitin carboxyl-terminal hydrolase 22/27/51
MPNSRPVTPAEAQVKEAQQGVPRYGCGMPSFPTSQPCTILTAHSAHLQNWLAPGPKSRLKEVVTHYKQCLSVVFDANPSKRQHWKGPGGKQINSLTPTYLCVQCTEICTEGNRLAHGEQTNHRFCGCLGI